MRHFLCCGVILAGVLGSATAEAGFDVSITGSATQQAGGAYLYSYILIDNPSSTVAISEFNIALNDPIGVSLITSPSDFFTFYNPGDPVITFDAFDTGISPGSAGVFSFVSMSAPGLVAESIVGLDSSTFTAQTSSGMVIGAASVVPEPSSVVMLGIGVLGSFGWLARSRRHRTAR